MYNIAIFASGNGSNAENIVNYFSTIENINVSLFLTNKPSAYVVKRAQNLDIECIVFNSKEFRSTDFEKIFSDRKIDFIVLAGFLSLISAHLVSKYEKKIVNIHPALLPKFGGKGMYGENVHKAVFEAGEKQSGISIHYVDEKYDSGSIIFQKSFDILPSYTVSDIEREVRKLEIEYFPKVIHDVIINSK